MLTIMNVFGIQYLFMNDSWCYYCYTFNTGQIRFLLEIKNSNTLKVGVCALARSHHDE